MFYFADFTNILYFWAKLPYFLEDALDVLNVLFAMLRKPVIHIKILF